MDSDSETEEGYKYLCDESRERRVAPQCAGCDRPWRHADYLTHFVGIRNHLRWMIGSRVRYARTPQIEATVLRIRAVSRRFAVATFYLELLESHPIRLFSTSAYENVGVPIAAGADWRGMRTLDGHPAWLGFEVRDPTDGAWRPLAPLVSWAALQRGAHAHT